MRDSPEVLEQATEVTESPAALPQQTCEEAQRTCCAALLQLHVPHSAPVNKSVPKNQNLTHFKSEETISTIDTR